MAKLKGKSKTSASAAAAAAAAANVERASVNDKKIADPAPSSEPVEEISKAAAEENTAVLDDKSKGAADDNKEGTENGGLNEQEGIEVEEEETKDGLDAKLREEVGDVEETKDGLDDKSDEGDEKEEDAKEEDGIVKPVGTDIIPGGGKMVDNDENVEGEGKAEEVKVDKKDDAKGEGSRPNKKPKRTRRKKKTAAASVAAAVSNDAGKTQDDAGKTQDNADKQGAAVAGKELKMADGMGLVFMCNAKTKQDCFNYKVLGLPASKKEMVAQIYKGMRLFLFDVDLRLMYGVYKAASPGGYSIEPKAFNSSFPAQVRFSVLNDRLPLPEEKFKEAIKENYYGKNKFDCQLSPEQVKKLCKLFEKAGKTPEKKISGGEETSFARGRKRAREVISVKPERIPSQGRKIPRQERERGNPRSGDRHGYARRGEDYPSSRVGDHHHLYADRREVYPPPGSLALPPPLATYAYGRQGEVYYHHMRDPPALPPQALDPRDYHRAVGPRQAVVEYRDAHGGGMYREPLPSYMAPASYAAPAAANLAPPSAAYVPSSTLYYRY